MVPHIPLWKRWTSRPRWWFDKLTTNGIIPFAVHPGLPKDLLPFILGLSKDHSPFVMGLSMDHPPFNLGLSMDHSPFVLSLSKGHSPFVLSLSKDIVQRFPRVRSRYPMAGYAPPADTVV